MAYQDVVANLHKCEDVSPDSKKGEIPYKGVFLYYFSPVTGKLFNEVIGGEIRYFIVNRSG